MKLLKKIHIVFSKCHWDQLFFVENTKKKKKIGVGVSWWPSKFWIWHCHCYGLGYCYGMGYISGLEIMHAVKKNGGQLPTSTTLLLSKISKKKVIVLYLKLFSVRFFSK